MEIGITSVAESAEQRWRKIIEAMRGSAAAEVWFRYKGEGGFTEAPAEPDLTRASKESAGPKPELDATT